MRIILIKMYVREAGCEGLCGINLALYSGRQRTAFVACTLMNIPGI